MFMYLLFFILSVENFEIFWIWVLVILFKFLGFDKVWERFKMNDVGGEKIDEYFCVVDFDGKKLLK